MIKYAKKGLREIFKANHDYKRAGIMLMGLIPKESVQYDLFIPTDKKKIRLMKTIDQVNRRFGRGAIKPLATGFFHNWKMRQENLSPNYTTKWNDLLVIPI